MKKNVIISADKIGRVLDEDKKRHSSVNVDKASYIRNVTEKLQRIAELNSSLNNLSDDYILPYDELKTKKEKRERLFEEIWTCYRNYHLGMQPSNMRPAEDLLYKCFITPLYKSSIATDILKSLVQGKIKQEVCGRAAKNSENWTWAHVRRAMVRCGFFGECPKDKSMEYWEDWALSDKDFGYAINSCDSSITPESVKTQCINHKTKRGIPHENIVVRICEYLQPVVNWMNLEK